MKIKLRDLTKEQWDNYVNGCRFRKCDNCIFNKVECTKSTTSSRSWINNKDMFSDKFLDQEIEIDEPLLTDEEKKYLENVIKPFRDKVLYIKKYFYPTDGEEEDIKIILDYDSTIILPRFEKNKYYKNLVIEKHYTLEELGLFENE